MKNENNIRYPGNKKLRLILAILCLLLELSLYFGTSALWESEENLLTGEGSFEGGFSTEENCYRQYFSPKHHKLDLISFLLYFEDVDRASGSIAVKICDAKDVILFHKVMPYAEAANGRFTDLPVQLELNPLSTYYLELTAEPDREGKYPTIGLCDTARQHHLPESRGLHGVNAELKQTQLVARYAYVDAIADKKMWLVAGIALLTFLGIAMGPGSNAKIRWGVSILLLFVTPIVLGWQMERLIFAEVYKLPITLSYHTLTYMPKALLLNLAILCGMEVVLFLLTHSFKATIFVTDFLITLLYSANYFVILYRGTPLRASDFSAAGTAAKVVGEYSLMPNAALAIVWGCALCLIVWGLQTVAVHSEFQKKQLMGYLVTVPMAVIMFLGAYHVLLGTDVLVRAGFDNENYRGFYQDMLYYQDGYLVASCLEIQNSRVVPLDGYSIERVENILSDNGAVDFGASTVNTEDLPHVILIMNESFADLRVLADLELTQDNLTFYNSLKDNTVRGYVNASVIGGGTANSEFEVFTGCSVAFLPVNYYPYQQAIKKPVNSMISTMHNYGYKAISMHPESAGNWNRANVYRYYDFDESYWKQDFAGAEIVHAGVSDAETYRKVEELYENRAKGEKLFIFDLTMQNHGGYYGKEQPFAVEETFVADPILDEYLSLVKKSDAAFEDLIHYFEQEDEKVLICMYGDHQPWVSDLITKAYKTTAGGDPLQMMNKYKTPFVIWTNYDMVAEEGYDISMNYLGGLVLAKAGIPRTPYFAFLEKQRMQYPIITMNGYVDANGNYQNWSGTGEEFPEYRMLQYNYLYDKNTVKWGY